MRSKKIFLIMLLSLSGCAPISNRDIVKSLPGTVPVAYDTPYSQELRCVGGLANKNNHKYVIAVGPIEDRTGKFSYNTGSEVTQGAEFMAISAIEKTNAFEQVDRLYLNITNNELLYANQMLLSDAQDKNNFKKGQGKVRKINYGVIKGSDYVLVGAITEINYLVDSQVAELNIDGWGGGWRHFWIDVGIDLRLINTKTTQIVKTASFRKQIYGYENKLGVFKFFGITLVDASLDRKRQEPISFAVRTTIEAAIADFTKYLYNITPEETSICPFPDSRIRYGEMTKNPNKNNQIINESNPIIGSNSYTIQLMASRDMESIQSFTYKNKLPNKTYVTEVVHKDGKKFFVLTMGNYPNKPSASEDMKKLPRTINAFIRSWSSLNYTINKEG